MTRTFALVLLLLAGCSSLPPSQQAPCACTVNGEASYACQVERYHNVAV